MLFNLKCQLCGKEFKSMNGLSRHIWRHPNMNVSKYYDQFLKSPNEGTCAVCHKKTKFIGMQKGYQKHCSCKCSQINLQTKEKCKNTCLDKYGVENPFQSKNVIDKIKKTCQSKYGCDSAMKSQTIQTIRKIKFLQLYGVENPMQLQSSKNKFKETNLERYGYDHPMKNSKIKSKVVESFNVKYNGHPMKLSSTKKKLSQTCIKNFGVPNPSQSCRVQQKKRVTCHKNFGVDYPMESEIVRRKSIETCMKKYGTSTGSHTESAKRKYKKTCMQNFGVDHYSKTLEGREICRANFLKIIESQILNGEALSPRIGYNERKVINELQSLISYPILRQKKMFSYFPDGYISELNLVIEYDEPWHNQIFQIKRDISKDATYKKYNLNVIRIKEQEWIEYKEIIKSKFIQLCEKLK